MRATGLMRFVTFGGVGFGIGGATAGLGAFYLGPGGFLVGPLLGGALGGASLGLALRDFRQVLILAVLGALGLPVGVMAGLTLGSFFNYYPFAIAAIVGAVVGGSLGVAFKDWRMVVSLAVVGAVGFGIGYVAGAVRYSIPIIRQVGGAGETEFIAISGIIGGASLGAALAYLESRRRASERRPRVR